MALFKECHSRAEIVAVYRAARARLWHPPSIRVVAAPPPPTGAPPPPRKPVDHDPAEPPLTVDDIPIIIRVVAGFYRVGTSEMTSPTQRHRLIEPRYLAMHLARVMTPASTTEIGRAFRRDHSTVMHALRKVDLQMIADEDVVKTVRRLRERVVRFHEKQMEEHANEQHGTS